MFKWGLQFFLGGMGFIIFLYELFLGIRLLRRHTSQTADEPDLEDTDRPTCKQTSRGRKHTGRQGLAVKGRGAGAEFGNGGQVLMLAVIDSCCGGEGRAGRLRGTEVRR